MGSHTYNAVYGTTRNPYDRPRAPADRAAAPARRWPPACCRSPTAATSAARSATRPTSTTSSALRPTVGLVPTAPDPLPLLGFGVNGPMARIGRRRRLAAERHGRAGSARSRLRAVATRRSSRGRSTATSAACASPGARISAVCRSIARVRDGARGAARDLRGARLRRRGRVPDLRDADEIFLTIRAWRSGAVLRAAARRASRHDEAGGDRGDRGGAGLAGADDRARDAPARRAVERMRRFSGALRVHAAAR